MPTLSLALIARDEQDTLPTLLASVEGAFDEVVLVDTGSKDATVEIFEQWAQVQIAAGALRRYVTDRFEWRDDFAAARAYADSLTAGEFIAWADCDDVVQGAHHLRLAAAQAPPEVVAFIAGYQYAHDPYGNVVCYLKRERLVRRGAGRWQGRVHEAQVFDGAVGTLDPSTCEWVHRKPGAAMAESGPRNLRILKSWLKDEPDNPRVLGYLGTEELAQGRARHAVRYFRRYLQQKTGWDEERAQVHRKLAQALMVEGDHDDAIEVAFEALRLLPAWPDSYLTLAEAHYHLGELGKAAEWARETLRRGCPDTLLIVNPRDYDLQPRVVLAGALGALGQLDEAIDTAEVALTLAPDHLSLQQGLAEWRSLRKRESTAKSVVGLAQMLVDHDEQLKALEVLRSAPHYAIDHPQVVGMRSWVRERIDHVERDEGFVPDDQVLSVGDQLPRCAFLLEGLREQVA